jgi:hypothetical protein
VPTGVLKPGKTTSVVPVNVPVAPLGSPDTLRLTVPVKPLTGVTVMLSEPFTFCANVSVLSAGDSVNPGAAADATTKVTVVVCVRGFEVPEPLEVPLMTSG